MAEKIYTGIGVSEGIRIGKAYVFDHVQFTDTDRNISEADTDSEVTRFRNTVQSALAEIERLIASTGEKLGKEKIGVIKGQKSILADPAYCPEIEKLIRKNLFFSEKAVKQITEKFALLFENLKSDYMKERAADVRDVGSRLLNLLSGRKTTLLSDINTPVILISSELSPSDTIQLNKNFILAFATQKGGKTSHTAIFAKSMGIPAAVGLTGLMESVADGDTVILDGTEGICIVNPQEELLRNYRRKVNSELEDQLQLKEFATKEAVTYDGQKILVAANIGAFTDVEYSNQQGAEAVGLLRTEQLYLSKSTFPSETEQFIEYKNIAQTFSPREVIVRTLDIGGDKALDYFKMPKEENPFLGYRAIRLCLDRKDLFMVQLRAILRASVFGKLSIMFPMISGYEELIAAKSILEEAKSALKKENIPYDEGIRIGIMVEIPSAALMADVLAKEVDFFSIGTNDLVQYTLAVDRGNEKVSYLYDYFNPAVIRLIKNIADAAHASGIPVGMCGGMAGDPVAVPLLVGLNLDELSMAAGVIPKIKYVISKISTERCKKLADLAVRKNSAKEIQTLLSEFYQSTVQT
jgi:phosphoenolpyruvate-protein phosphotransferase (PTS system enzyme I)